MQNLTAELQNQGIIMLEQLLALLQLFNLSRAEDDLIQKGNKLGGFYEHRQ